MEENRKKIHVIPGTKLATNNTQLLVSSGMPSLDYIIGGGLAAGTIFLIDEDICGYHAKIMLQYFLAEGIINKHSLYVASQEVDPESIIRNVPAVIPMDVIDIPKKDISDDKLTIAWRYQHLPSTKIKPTPDFGHFYDLSRRMDAATIDNADIKYWTAKDHYDPSAFTFRNPAYHDLLRNIKQTIDDGQFSLNSKPETRNILRIGLHSLGSPLWLPNDISGFSSRLQDLDMFIYCLRAIARSAFVVIAITIPSQMIDQCSVSRCIHSSDTVIRLEAFAGTDLEKNSALSDYQGFCQFKKFPAINTLVNKDPGPVDYAFKLRRKKFTIEPLHLPPAQQDSSELEQDDNVSMGCGSSTKNLLEF